MRTSTFRCRCGLVALVLGGTLGGCGNTNAPGDAGTGLLSGHVTIDGSATVLPLSRAMAAAFRKANPAVQFDIEFSGTGGGFKKFCSGGVDIEDASRPIRSDESDQCKAKH